MASKPKPSRRRSRARSKPGDPYRLHSILVPTDLSELSGRALPYAEALAARFGAKLMILYVIDPVGLPAVAKALLEPEKLADACRRELERFLTAAKVKPELVEGTLIQTGAADEEIVRTARVLKSDLIVLSTHGRTGLKHALLGSATEKVTRHAPCPVLIVREKEREFVTEPATVAAPPRTRTKPNQTAPRRPSP